MQQSIVRLMLDYRHPNAMKVLSRQLLVKKELLLVLRAMVDEAVAVAAAAIKMI